METPHGEGDTEAFDNEAEEEFCANCGEPLDAVGECINPGCEDSPNYEGNVDDDEVVEFEEGFLDPDSGSEPSKES